MWRPRFSTCLDYRCLLILTASRGAWQGRNSLVETRRAASPPAPGRPPPETRQAASLLEISTGGCCLFLRFFLVRHRRLIFQIARTEGVFLAGDFQERGIELHKRSVHGAMIGMTGVAHRFFRNVSAVGAVAKAEECPSIPRFIFEVDRPRHDLSGLVMSALVDGPLAASDSTFEHEDSLVRPFTGGHKSLIGLRVDENVVKHGMFRQVDCRT